MDEFLQKSLQVLNIEKNPTNGMFFSNGNIESIQKSLIIETRKHTGYNISKQHCSDVVMAMQYFYVNYPQYTTSSDSERNVSKLNSLVVQDLSKQTISGVKQHLFYLKSIQQLPEPLEYGKSTGISGKHSLEYKPISL